MTNRNDQGEFADYYSFMGKPEILYLPTRDFFPAAKVEARTRKGFAKWLTKNRAIHSMTWAPGLPTIIRDKLALKSGWQDKPGVNTLNKYEPATPNNDGDPDDARRWLELGATLWGDDLNHILDWMACRVQHPEIKINHSLLLGSAAHGIGKDMWLRPLRRAVGPWNFNEISARRAKDKATNENPWLASTVLLVSEVHDLGDARFHFYETTKDWAAAPPDTLLVRDLWAGAYHVQNVVGVIYTSNHKLDGLYLPAEDRRHFVAWSDAGIEHAGADEEARAAFWRDYQAWYDAGGLENAAAYLATRDLTLFDAKAPPPKTDAWYEIVEAGKSGEDEDIGEALDAMDAVGEGDGIGRPDAITIETLRRAAGEKSDLSTWLVDPANSTKIKHRFDAAGYDAVRNPDNREGRWHVDGKKVMVYGRRGLKRRQQLAAAKALINRENARARRAALHIV